MNPYLRKRLEENTANFKRSVDRIADKYSKLQDEEDVLEVEIDKVKLKTLSKYLTQCKDRSVKSLSDLTDHSFSSDVTAHGQSNLSCKDDGADDSDTSSDLGKDDNAEGTLRSLDESWRNSESELLPEDQDEDLQMSLSSQGSSLAELYPTMVSRIGRAWHRRTVSSSLLRRYRRWRQQPSRNLSNTFDVTAGTADDPPKPGASKRVLGEGSGGPAKRMRTEAAPRPAHSTLTSLSNGKLYPALREETPRLISPVDYYDHTEPQESSLNETFLVSELSPPNRTPLSPLQRPCTTAASSVDPSLGIKRLAGPSRAAETPSVAERPDIYSSPVRPSPLKVRRTSTLSRSPLVFPRSPREHDGDWSRAPMRPRSLSTSMSSPTKRPVVLVKMLYPQHSNQSSQPLSPLPARAANGQRRFARNLSFDSTLPRPVPYSAREVDEDFLKLYHKFVCQNKSSAFSGLPCRLCGRSSTSLAALALSPHRSILRKRYREQRCDSRPQSKRLRDETYAHSPGSKRHSSEMLRRCLSPPEVEPPPSPSEHRTQRSAAYLEAWMERHRPHFSSPGCPV